MSLVRPLLLSLAALFIAPAVAHAEDDEICVGWVHVFTVEREHELLEMTSENTCLMHATSLDELEPFADGKPYRGDSPAWTKEKECKALDRQIDEMRRALAQARSGLPGATAARDAAAGEKNAAVTAHENARAAWEIAAAELAAAKAAYADVFDIVVETERDGRGRVVVTRELGYNADTELGRAVLDAIRREEQARRALEAAFANLGAANPKAQAAQFRVDQYTNIINTYPAAIAEARAYAAEIGCK